MVETIVTGTSYSVASWRGRSTEKDKPQFRLLHKDGKPRHWNSYAAADKHRVKVMEKNGLPPEMVIVVTTTVKFMEGPPFHQLVIDDPYKLLSFEGGIES